jgi:hypothetical protein
MLISRGYIAGFIKRAAEHGLTSKQANTLLKEATTFGATRKLLRELRSKGVKLHRTPENVPLAEMGFHYNLADNSVYIPRKEKFFKSVLPLPANSELTQYGARARKGSMFSKSKRPKLDYNYSPRQLLFHEAGHARHFSEDPRLVDMNVNMFSKKIKELKKFFAGRHFENSLIKERIANNHAIDLMKQYGVPMENIENYIKGQDTLYGTYASKFHNKWKNRNGFYARGYSVDPYAK